MNNIELEQKIKEIIAIENYFDMQVAIKDFDNEYKKSDFYRNTKMPLKEVVREARVHYALQLKDLGNKLQNLIDGLTLEKVNEILDQMGNVFGQENTEIGEMLETIKGLR